MSTELAKCFPTLNVQPCLVRWKHWIQHDLPHTDGSPQETTLINAQFCNVYEWIEAMRKVPHHGFHLHKQWKAFVTKPYGLVLCHLFYSGWMHLTLFFHISLIFVSTQKVLLILGEIRLSIL